MHPEELIDRRLGGKFYIRGLIDRQDFVNIYWAYDETLCRNVAVKAVLPKAPERARERLRREAIALARVVSPWTPAVHQADTDPETGIFFVVRTWVDGHPLSAYLDHPFTESQILALATDLAGGLAEAHRSGILHRALEPEQLIVTTSPEGAPSGRLLDFRIAAFDEKMGFSKLTAPNEAINSSRYASPEALQQRPTSTRSDVYSFGAIFFRLACGHAPYGETPTEMAQAFEKGQRASLKIRPGLELSPMVKAVLRRCIELDPTDRFDSCVELHEVLSNTLRERPSVDPRAITALNVDDKHRYLIAGRHNGEIDVFNAQSGAHEHTFKGHRGAINALAFRPESEEFLAASADGHIHLWSISELCQAGTWPGLSGRKSTIQFSPFGYIFASGEPSGKIRLWSLLEKNPLGELLGHEGGITALHFLPEGRYLASASEDGATKLWDIGAMTLAESCQWQLGPVSHFAMHVRERFVVAMQDGSLAMGRWNKPAPQWHRAMHSRPISRLFEQDGGQGLFSVGLDGAIHCVDVFDGSLRRDSIWQLGGIRAASLHLRSEYLYTANDETILRWTWGPGMKPSMSGVLNHTGWQQDDDTSL